MRGNCHWATNEISRTASLLKLAINKNQFHLQLVSRATVKLLANQIAAHLQDWEGGHTSTLPQQPLSVSCLQLARRTPSFCLGASVRKFDQHTRTWQTPGRHQSATRKGCSRELNIFLWQGRYLLRPMELQPKKERLQYLYFLFFKLLILPYADSQSLLKLHGKFLDKCCHSHPDVGHFHGDSGTGLHKKSDFMMPGWLNLLDDTIRNSHPLQSIHPMYFVSTNRTWEVGLNEEFFIIYVLAI